MPFYKLLNGGSSDLSGDIADCFVAYGLSGGTAPTVALNFLLSSVRPLYGYCPALNTDQFWARLGTTFNDHANVHSIHCLRSLIFEISELDSPLAHSIGNHIVNSGFADHIMRLLNTDSVDQLDAVSLTLFAIQKIHPALSEKLINTPQRADIIARVFERALSTQVIPVGALVMFSFANASKFYHDNFQENHSSDDVDQHETQLLSKARSELMTARESRVLDYENDEANYIPLNTFNRSMATLRTLFEIFLPVDDTIDGFQLPLLSGPKFELYKRFIEIIRPQIPAIVGIGSLSGFDGEGASVVASYLRDYSLAEVTPRVNDITAFLHDILSYANTKFPQETDDLESDILYAVHQYRIGAHYNLGVCHEDVDKMLEQATNGSS